MYNHFRSYDAEFVHCKHKGKLSRFKLRNIFAIDFMTLKPSPKIIFFLAVILVSQMIR